jgi:crotonobetaine/carnitine-CoA ligase
MVQSQTTLLQVLARRLDNDPDGPYLDFCNTETGSTVSYTAREMDVEATRLARGLASLGVVRGDRVATLLDNRAEQVVSFFAALKLGAVQVPINTAYKREFLRHQLADSGARAVIVQGDYASRAAEAIGVDATPDLAHCIVVGSSNAVVDAVPTTSWDELGETNDTPIDGGLVRPDDLACLIYTAGTTGPSKGCMLPHNYVVNLAHQVCRVLRRRPDDVVLTPLPLFHFNAISIAVVGTLITGGHAVIERKFSVRSFWPEVKRTQATIVTLLGPLAILIANADDHPDQRGHKLRLCAASTPPDIVDLWHERFGCRPFSGGFGLTEASLISMLEAGQAGKPGAAGRINLEDFDVQIVDDDDVAVAIGDVGEIVCRPKAPNLMFTGYWNRPEATVEATRNLWFHTGDLGRIDDDGFLFFVDRKKDAMRRRGENISSFEMEKTLFGHAALRDVAVHAVPSELGEDDVKITAVLQHGEHLAEEELCRWTAERVPYFAIPRYVEFRDELPRNPVGRVLKYQLRDEGVTAATWDREAAGVTFERK